MIIRAVLIFCALLMSACSAKYSALPPPPEQPTILVDDPKTCPCPEESVPRPSDPDSQCSRHDIDILERHKIDSKRDLEAAFSDLDSNPSQKNLNTKDHAAMLAAKAASDLDYARVICADGSL